MTQNLDTIVDSSAALQRPDGRRANQLRDIHIQTDWVDQAEGSVLIQAGKTMVLCTASLTAGVPRWKTGSGSGWVTAEYAMLPRATSTRSPRESVRGKIGGRTHEISRLIGRSLRAGIDLEALGENTIQLDCDVLQADGSTRTTAITGAFIALARAVAWGQKKRIIAEDKPGRPVITQVISAVSVGIIAGEARLDLPYVEDVNAQTDMNVVCASSGTFVEVQGTAEGAPFSRKELDCLLDLAAGGCADLARLQQAAISSDQARFHLLDGIVS